MLKRFIKTSNIIELIEESSNEDGTSHKAVLRVTGSAGDWSALMVKILQSPDNDSEFLVSVRKEYFISDANKPSFVWVLMIWGDLLQACSEVGPVIQTLTQAAQEPLIEAPARGPEKAAPTKTAHRKVYKSEDGSRVVSAIPLPFRRGQRDDPGHSRSLSSRKGVGAYVSTIQDGGI